MGRKKAVLVGINYPGTKAQLSGCINDVWRIRKSLVEQFGFEEDDINILIDTDPSYVQPTGANIRRALLNLVSNARSGDILFFHYSGHGTRLPAETGEKDDTGYDECIVPCDMNLITDDDFREIVDQVPEGVLVTLISDSCHSGGLIDNEKEQIGESTMENKSGGTLRGLKGFLHQGLREIVPDGVQEALENRGIDLPFGHRNRYADDDDDHFQKVAYGGEDEVRSRAMPISSYVQILRERTGKDDIDVGNIRPSLFDSFGDESSAKVKKFVKVLFQSIKSGDHKKEQGDDDEDGGSGSGSGRILRAVGSLAEQFLRQKLDGAGDSDEYVKPALETQVSADPRAAVFAGVKSKKSRPPPKGGVLVSGCQSHETSADANPSGKPDAAFGAMSNAIQTVLAETDGPITNRELVIKVRQLLRKQGYSQHPGLYCNDHVADRIFIC